jgi:hypothetical protein
MVSQGKLFMKIFKMVAFNVVVALVVLATVSERRSKKHYQNNFFSKLWQCRGAGYFQKRIVALIV